MHIFLSFSQDRSHKVALAFRNILQRTLVHVNAWISSRDIAKGEEWWQALKGAIADPSGVGLFFLTKEACSSSWMMFEAGGIAMHSEAKVIVVNVDVDDLLIPAPLRAYQQLKLEKEDIGRLLLQLNRALTPPAPEAVLQLNFDQLWQTFKAELDVAAFEPKPQRPQPTVLEMFTHLSDSMRRVEAGITRIRLGEEAWSATAEGKPSIYETKSADASINHELQRLASYELSGNRLEVLRYLLSEPPAPDEPEVMYQCFSRFSGEVATARRAKLEAEMDLERMRRDALPRMP